MLQPSSIVLVRQRKQEMLKCWGSTSYTVRTAPWTTKWEISAVTQKLSASWKIILWSRQNYHGTVLSSFSHSSLWRNRVMHLPETQTLSIRKKAVIKVFSVEQETCLTTSHLKEILTQQSVTNDAVWYLVAVYNIQLYLVETQWEKNWQYWEIQLLVFKPLSDAANKSPQAHLHVVGMLQFMSLT